MPFYKVLKSYTVPKPDGSGHLSRGVVVEMSKKAASAWKDVLQPYELDDRPRGPERTIQLTQSELDERIEGAGGVGRRGPASQEEERLGTCLFLSLRAFAPLTTVSVVE